MMDFEMRWTSVHMSMQRIVQVEQSMIGGLANIIASVEHCLFCEHNYKAECRICAVRALLT
jgi:hypothetical protein